MIVNRFYYNNALRRTLANTIAVLILFAVSTATVEPSVDYWREIIFTTVHCYAVIFILI